MCVGKDKEMDNTKSTSLLIMAAGIGSRFGGGIKQLEPVGLRTPNKTEKQSKRQQG